MRTYVCPLCHYQFVAPDDEPECEPICRVAQAYDMVRYAPRDAEGDLNAGDWWQVLMKGCRGEMVRQKQI